MTGSRSPEGNVILEMTLDEFQRVTQAIHFFDDCGSSFGGYKSLELLEIDRQLSEIENTIL